MPSPLHPDIDDVLAAGRAAGGPPIHEQTVHFAREAQERSTRVLSGDGPRMAQEMGMSIPGPDGMTVDARAYLPEGELAGSVCYLHGGGWVIGSLGTVEPLCRALAEAAGAAFVSIGYRLAPEDPFPAGLRDALAAARWCAEHAHETLGTPAGRTAIAGDSAGANLATVVARRLGREVLCAQALGYPVCDGSLAQASYRELDESVGLTGADMAWFWDHYGADPADPDASPLRASLDELAASPPAFVLTGSHDPLRDEGEQYAARLREAGVEVTARRYDGCAHGFLRWIALAQPARDAVAEMGGWLGRNLAEHRV